MRYRDLVEDATDHLLKPPANARRLKRSIAQAATGRAVSTGDDILDLPPIKVGDEILFGKFKNRRAVVKGFTTDKHHQPVLKTTKGDQPLFKLRLRTLMDPDA